MLEIPTVEQQVTAVQTVPSTDVTEAERARRLAAVRARMADQGLAALVVTDPANIYYLSGYDAWSFYTPQCLVVTADEAPVLFARAMDAAGAGFTAWLAPDDVEGYPEGLVHRPDVHPFDWIANRCLERGLVPTSGSPVVGVEGDCHFFSPRGYLALAAGLPGARLADSRELVNWVRVVKAPCEVEHLRRAGRVAQHAMEVALDAVTAGRRQCDVVAEIMAAQACGTPEHAGAYPAIIPLLPSGDGAGTPHLTFTERRFARGEATTIELAGVSGRYHAPLARTVVLGEPPRRLAETAEVVRDGLSAALDALRPGALSADVHAAWDAVIRRAGLTKDSRIGYSIGIGYPPDWGERTVSLRAGDTTVLEAGMAFHVILGMWMDGWGYEVSEPVVVTPTGVERLTDLPQELLVKP